MLILPGCIAAARQNQRRLNAEQPAAAQRPSKANTTPGSEHGASLAATTFYLFA